MAWESNNLTIFTKMIRVVLLIWLIAGAGLTSFAQKTNNNPSRPNIIFILTDDQRWDALGYAGNELIHTPEMDKLAEQGTYFSHAMVRSEEHTSELQSQSTISYAVFCLKKKKKTKKK